MEPSFDDQDPKVSQAATRSWQEAGPLSALMRIIDEQPDDWDLSLL